MKLRKNISINLGDVTNCQWELFFVATWAETAPPEAISQKDVLKNSTKFTEKNLCQSLFFNEAAGSNP